MKRNIFSSLIAVVVFISLSNAQKGNLFIIGGGDRTDELVRQLLQTAALQPKDYVVVLPMSGEAPDSSFYYIKTDLQKACDNPIVNLNFTREKTTNKAWLDSVKQAKLIFITGGDQVRFMKIVYGTPLYNAIRQAYNEGATISGTSAGAAVMSKNMVTGNQLRGDTVYHATFDRLLINNIEFQEGLGLLDSAVIDQHFVVRSRYNRMISALAAFPSYTCIGIDESTAIVVHLQHVKVVGEGQVLVMRKPQQLGVNEKGLIKFSDVQLSIYTAGDSFELQ